MLRRNIEAGVKEIHISENSFRDMNTLNELVFMFYIKSKENGNNNHNN